MWAEKESEAKQGWKICGEASGQECLDRGIESSGERWGRGRDDGWRDTVRPSDGMLLQREGQKQVTVSRMEGRMEGGKRGEVEGGDGG